MSDEQPLPDGPTTPPPPPPGAVQPTPPLTPPPVGPPPAPTPPAVGPPPAPAYQPPAPAYQPPAPAPAPPPVGPPPAPAYQPPAPTYQAPAPTYQAPQPAPTYQAPGYGYAGTAPAAPANPGQTLGIVGIVLGVLQLWLVGLPLSIASMVKSGKAGASRTLGMVGLVLNLLAMGIALVVGLAVILPAINAARDTISSLPTSTPTATDEPSAEETTVAPSDTAAPSDTGAPDVEVVTLDMPYAIGGLGNGYWALDASTVPDGYELTTFDVDGVNEFTRTADGGAWLTTYQGVDPSYAGLTDADASAQVLAGLLAITPEEVLAQEGTMTVASAFGGPAVELLVGGADNGTDRMIAAARVFSEGHYLVLTYQAPSASFQPDDWATLTSIVSIDDSGT